MKFNYYFTFFILCFFYIQDIFGNITYQKIIDQQCKLKKYETNIGLFTIANCFNNKLRNEVYVFLNDKNIFYDEMKLDYNMLKRQDNFILFSGIIKGKNTPLACNRKNILIDFNKINPQLIEFGVEDLCILLPKFGQRFFGVSIDTLDFEFISNQLQLPEIITYLGSVEGQLSSINLYSNIYREYLNIQILNTLYFDIFKKYKVYINHNKINLNDPYVKSSQFKNLTYNKYAECDEKFSHNTQSGKVQLLSCMKNEILINNKRVIVADTPNDLKSKIYFSKKFSTFFGFSSVKQESKDNFIQYCGNDLFFLDTSHETPNLQAINFNVNCFYIKDFIETEHELKIVLNSNDEIIYKNNAIHFIQKNKYSDNNFYHTRKENIPYNIGEVATYKNKKTTITQINTYRDNRIFINNKKIIGAQLLRIFEHDDNKNIFLGGIYEYNYATFHPSPCLKQLFILDITNSNNTQFYLFKNIFKAEFCIRDDIKIEKISKGLKFSIEKYSSFIYTNTLSRLPYIPSIFINLLNKRFLIAEKAPLPHYSPYNCEDEEFIENYREDSYIYRTFGPRVEHNTLHSRVKNILFIDNRYYNRIYHMNEEYLISTIEDYNYEKSFSYFRIPLLSGILYYDHRKIIAGVKNLAGRGDIFRIAGNDKFMLGAAEVRNPSNEDGIIINYFFTDVTFPNPTLYILGLKETPNSISEVSTENDAIIIKFIDKSLIKYDKGKFLITDNPNNKVFIEEKTVPYDIHTVDTISTPSGELKLHTLPDRSYFELSSKRE